MFKHYRDRKRAVLSTVIVDLDYFPDQIDKFDSHVFSSIGNKYVSVQIAPNMSVISSDVQRLLDWARAIIVAAEDCEVASKEEVVNGSHA